MQHGVAWRRTITLTARPPVRIRVDKWPAIASGGASWPGGDHCWLRVRQHEDGRAIVYAVCYRTAGNDYRGGELLPPGADLIAAVRRVGNAAGVPARVIRETIADLMGEQQDAEAEETN